MTLTPVSKGVSSLANRIILVFVFGNCTLLLNLHVRTDYNSCEPVRIIIFDFSWSYVQNLFDAGQGTHVMGFIGSCL
jgi:hypothetical protein